VLLGAGDQHRVDLRQERLHVARSQLGGRLSDPLHLPFAGQRLGNPPATASRWAAQYPSTALRMLTAPVSARITAPASPYSRDVERLHTSQVYAAVIFRWLTWSFSPASRLRRGRHALLGVDEQLPARVPIRRMKRGRRGLGTTTV
jgi:hypothetical protein